MKIVINACYGGFNVSKAVYDELGIPWDGYGYLNSFDLTPVSEDVSECYGYRTDLRLIAAIEKVGLDKAGGRHTILKIVDVPDGIEWELNDYDGSESIHEAHRSWE